MNKCNIVLGLLMLGTLNACHCATVQPGHVGIKVNMLGSSQGVDHEQLTVGWHMLTMNESFYDFPTFEQNYVWTKSANEGNKGVDESFTFQTRDGLTVGADIGITYHIDADKVPAVFQKFRRGVEEITDIFIHNYVRDALNDTAGSLPIESVYGEGKVALMQNVQARVAEQVAPLGITVVRIYVVGAFRLPESITTSINAKIAATQLTQQRDNEVKQTEAEAKKAVAAAQGRAQSLLLEAEAQSKANRILSDSITTTLVEYERVKKWNGQMPQYTGGGTPLIQMSSAK